MNEISYKMFFKAFSNKTRFEIIQILRKGPRNVTEICKDLGFEQSRVSHNLKCLVACGFVYSRQEGKNRVYSLDEKYTLPILKNIDKHLRRYSERLEVCGILEGRKTCRWHQNEAD